jgi:hypothetical protein
MAFPLQTADGVDIGASESLSHPALLAMALEPRSAVPIANRWKRADSPCPLLFGLATSWARFANCALTVQQRFRERLSARSLSE